MNKISSALAKITGLALATIAAGALTLGSTPTASGPAIEPTITIETVASTEPITTVFGDSVDFNRVSVDTELGLAGTVQQTWAFTVDTDQANVTNGQLQDYLSPDPSVGTITSAENAGQTTYTVYLEGKDAIEFNTKLGSYIPGAYFQLEEPNGFYLWPGYNVRMYLPVTESKLAGGVDGAYTYNLKLPFWNSFDPAGQALVAQGVIVSGNTVSGTQSNMQGNDLTSHIYLAAAGPTLASLIVMALLLLLLLALVLLFIRHRAATRDRRRKAKARRKNAAAAATSSGSFAAPQTAVDNNPTIPLTYPLANPNPAPAAAPYQVTENVLPATPSTPAEPALPTAPMEPVQQVQPVQPVQPVQQVEPVQPVQQVEPAQPVEPSYEAAPRQAPENLLPGVASYQAQASYPQPDAARKAQPSPQVTAWQGSFTEQNMQ
ncbi:MAG: hypothetical protein SPI83_00580 [Rothia sp. (in: high G+C Gram-positive bacteria)]|nr:hypothetical protein [Rothia sp. (in: high G+C Gram-positive bacteria)]